jgi:AraC-like DNA-binding protein
VSKCNYFAIKGGMVASLQQGRHRLGAGVDWTTQVESQDAWDVVGYLPEAVGRGVERSIALRPGMDLVILDAPLLHESWEREEESLSDVVELHFHIQGHHDDGLTQVGDREFCIRGSGAHPQHRAYSLQQRALEVALEVEMGVLRSLFAQGEGELPPEFEHWLRSAHELRYARVGKVTPGLERVLWEIVRCPFDGLQKRLFLEGKALELMGFVVGMEQTLQGRSRVLSLPRGTRERLHYARELVVEHVQEPLSLGELARRSQLNEYTLKRGFKQEFGRTVFDYLLDYRLEQARQMLERGTLSVATVMAAVGLRNRSYFAAAFRQRFGLNPKQYQQRFQ